VSLRPTFDISLHDSEDEGPVQKGPVKVPFVATRNSCRGWKGCVIRRHRPATGLGLLHPQADIGDGGCDVGFGSKTEVAA